MSHLNRFIALSAILLSVSACSWVKVQPGAEAVSLRTGAEVADCKYLGTATGKTKARVGIIARSEKKVASEVFNLARNEAASIGGNTLVEKTALQDGRQTFDVYRCP